MSKGMVIIADTREQLPFDFGPDVSVISRKLDTGDYSLDGYEGRITIERKRPGEMFSMCGGGRARFERELSRMQDINQAHRDNRAIVVIEGSSQMVMDAQGKYTKIKPATVMRSTRQWIVRYDVHFYFMGGKVHGLPTDITAREHAKAWTFQMLSGWFKVHG